MPWNNSSRVSDRVVGVTGFTFTLGRKIAYFGGRRVVMVSAKHIRGKHVRIGSLVKETIGPTDELHTKDIETFVQFSTSVNAVLPWRCRERSINGRYDGGCASEEHYSSKKTTG